MRVSYFRQRVSVQNVSRHFPWTSRHSRFNNQTARFSIANYSHRYDTIRRLTSFNIRLVIIIILLLLVNIRIVWTFSSLFS